jgi:hypothetical protein
MAEGVTTVLEDHDRMILCHQRSFAGVLDFDQGIVWKNHVPLFS